MSDIEAALVLFTDANCGLRRTQRILRMVTGDIGQSLEDELMLAIRRMNDAAFNEYEWARQFEKRVQTALANQKETP